MQNNRQFKVGDKFEVVKADQGFKVGEIITLQYDDGSSCLRFINDAKKTGWMVLGREVVPYLTPCEKLGYKVGDKFEIIGNTKTFHHFDIGTIVTLKEDDGDDAPYFVDSKGDTQYVHLDDIRKIVAEAPKEEDNMITIPCPEGYIFDGIRKLNKGDFQWNPDGTVDEWKAAGSSRGTYIVLKKAVPETLELKFERIPGLTIHAGEYYTDNVTPTPNLWDCDTTTFGKCSDGTKIWKRVN